MMDYSLFDSFLDSVLIIDQERKIVYANEPVANLLDLPRRRLKPGVLAYDVIQFQDQDLFCMPHGDWGRKETGLFREVDFQSQGGKKGRVLITFSKANETHWLVIMRDVGLEQTLHLKYKTELAQKEAALVDLRKAHGELENYSKNLERMVEQRTAEIAAMNRLLEALLDSLGQAFLVFNSEGKCLSVYSKACLTLLECEPVGKKVWDVLKLSADESRKIEKWVTHLFSEMVPFSDLVELGPDEFSHSLGKSVSLNYYPIRDEHEKVVNVVLVGTDRTNERAALEALAKEKAYAQMVVRIVKDRLQFLSFVKEAQLLMKGLKSGSMDLTTAARALHTIKGGAGLFSLIELQSDSHELEDEFAEKFRGASPQTLIQDRKILEGVTRLQEKLDRFLFENKNLIGRDPSRLEPWREIDLEKIKSFERKLREKNVTENLLAEFIESFLMTTVKQSFSHFEGMAESLADSLGKQIKPFIWSGEETKIYPESLSEVITALTHIFRNAIDHGLESPQERASLGKDPQGQMRVTFSKLAMDGKKVLSLTIEDDGRGIDPDKIRTKLNLPKLNDFEAIQHIFDPGFSTKDEVSHLSGRGVGLDAVAAAVRGMGGSVQVESQVGLGTQFILKIPVIF